MGNTNSIATSAIKGSFPSANPNDAAQVRDVQYIKAGVGLFWAGFALVILSLLIMIKNGFAGFLFFLIGASIWGAGGIMITKYSNYYNSDAPIDCQGSWSTWSACSANCGGGTQTSTYTITQQASNGGAMCPATNGQVNTQTCNTQACAVPVDCQVTWGTPSSCSGACGGGSGVTTSIGTITQQPANGGASCPSGIMNGSTYTANSNGTITQTTPCTNSTACGKTWTNQGYFYDGGGVNANGSLVGNPALRAIPNQIGGNTYTSLSQCETAALAANPNYNVIGLQDGAQCFAGTNSNYSQYGKASCSNPLGCAYINNVYTYQ